MQNEMMAASASIPTASQARLIAMATTGIPVERASQILAIPVQDIVSWLQAQPVPLSITLPDNVTDVNTLYEYMIYVTTSRERADTTSRDKARHLRSLLLNSAIEIVEGGTPQTLRSISDALAVVHRVARDEDEYGNKTGANSPNNIGGNAVNVVHVNLGGLLQPRGDVGHGVVVDGGLQSRPVLNSSSQVIGVQSGDDITPLASMSPAKLRELAGTARLHSVHQAEDSRKTGLNRLKSTLQSQLKPQIDESVDVDALFEGVELPD